MKTLSWRGAIAATTMLAAPTMAGAQSYYLPAGIPVSLMTRTELNTKDNRAGDRFYLEVAEAVRAKGQVIIPAGAVAVGEVVRSERNGHFGKSGKIDARILYIDTSERRYLLTGATNDRGRSGTVPTVAAIAAIGILGGLVHGTSGYLKAGTVVTAYTAEDIAFTLRAPATEPSFKGLAVEADEPLAKVAVRGGDGRP